MRKLWLKYRHVYIMHELDATRDIVENDLARILDGLVYFYFLDMKNLCLYVSPR